MEQETINIVTGVLTGGGVVGALAVGKDFLLGRRKQAADEMQTVIVTLSTRLGIVETGQEKCHEGRGEDQRTIGRLEAKVERLQSDLETAPKLAGLLGEVRGQLTVVKEGADAHYQEMRKAGHDLRDNVLQPLVRKVEELEGIVKPQANPT